MDNLPHWLSTELQVQRTFQLCGFRTEKVSIAGRQIDLIAIREDVMSFSEEKWVIEITTERVGAMKGGTDSQKLLLAQKEYGDRTKLMLISTKGFTDDQKATLNKLGIVAITWGEFEGKMVNFSMYCHSKLKELENPTKPDIGYNKALYVEPSIELVDQGGGRKRVNVEEWAEDLLHGKGPIIYAVLGDLGAGKTTILQRVLEKGCAKYLESPGDSLVPLLIPMGRYKQHSGDIEQMLMSELRAAGQPIFPNALIRHYIETRRVLLLLDGLDEVHPITNSNDVLETVTAIFSAIHDKAIAVLSCRRQFLESGEHESAYFGSYTQPKLEIIRAGLAQKLRGQATTYLAYVDPFTKEKIYEYLNRQCGYSRSQCEEFFSRFYGFDKMASTPVLLAMMGTAIRERLIDPNEKDPYPLVRLYTVYTRRWIERDTGRAKLSQSQRANLSRSLADAMMNEGRESETWENIRILLKRDPSWGDNALTDEEAELDIRNSGFLIRDTDDKFRFIHRSIMEFFSAGVSLDNLLSGGKPRGFPSDGFRIFFCELAASHWETVGYLFPPAAWASERGDAVINEQMSVLSATSSALSKKRPVSLNIQANVSTFSDMSFYGIIIEGIRWSHRDALLSLHACRVVGIQLSLSGKASVFFEKCTFDRSILAFGGSPDQKNKITDVSIDAHSEKLGLPHYIWDLAHLTSLGAVVMMGGVRWVVRREWLELCGAMMAKISGKISIENFYKGTHAQEFREVLPKLVAAGFVHEDTSRKPHQLELKSKARTLIGEFGKNPTSSDHQEQFMIFSLTPR